MRRTDVDRDERLRAFFYEYEARFRSALEGHDDVEGTASAFAEYFVEASPLGVHGGENGEQFRAMIPRGNAFYRAIGTHLMRIERIEVTWIDESHALVRVAWHTECRRASDGANVPIDFEVVYLVQLRAEGPKIFAYVTGDERRTLRAHGLLPNDPSTPDG